MKYTKVLIFCCLMICLIACQKKSRGYDDITELYKASAVALKSKDKTIIENFIKDLLPDENSAAYMQKKDCIYRGYPEGLKKYPYAVDSAIIHYTNVFYNYALEIEERGSLNDLEFIGFDEVLSPEPLNETKCKCQEVLFESPYALFVSTKNNDTISFSFGEILKVNGKWKGFTDFKL